MKKIPSDSRMKANLTHVSGTIIRLEFVNESDSPMYLDPWKTITREGRPASGECCFYFDPSANYKGALIKRIPYTSNDQLTIINPGQQLLSVEYDFSEDYDISRAGSVRVQYGASHTTRGVEYGLWWVESNWVDLF